MNGSLAFAYQKAFSTAIFLILCGLIKKAGADWLGANIVDRVYANPGMFSSVEALTAVIAYGVQIYGDFSGYSDIAIGCASILGFKLPDNFNRPYLSFSITVFWRRWHMTLGAWFRDYLYISLGGNRKRVYLNLMITMLLCGLWHNAACEFHYLGRISRPLPRVRTGGGNDRKAARPFLVGDTDRPHGRHRPFRMDHLPRVVVAELYRHPPVDGGT
jgi:D-alanyl-lipoteichoic acid acyltransferase DltB (MBOAT superfamily)